MTIRPRGAWAWDQPAARPAAGDGRQHKRAERAYGAERAL